MLSIRIVLLFLVLAASGCAASTHVVGEPTGEGRTVAEGPVGPTLTDAELAAALATPVPLPSEAVEPTPTPLAALSVVRNHDNSDDDSDDEPAASENEHGDDGEGASTNARPGIADAYTVGSCHEAADGRTTSAIPCNESHRAEVVLIGEFPHDFHDPFPGYDVANDLVNTACGPHANSIGLVDASGMTTIPLFPNPAEWQKGDRSWVCFVKFDKSRSRSLTSIAASQQAEAARQEAERAAQRATQESATQERNEQRVAGQQIQVGDCTGSDAVTRVLCSQPHSYKAYARTNLASAGGVYPGESLMYDQSLEFCRREHTNQELQGDIFAVWPNRWEWEDYGIHGVTCLVKVS